MSQPTSIQAIEELVSDQISGMPGIFLVEVRIKPTNNIKVFLDADEGLSIEKCVAINRAVYRQMEEKGWYPDGNFSLEVSSPGLDEPLKLNRQYRKNIGRKLEVVMEDGTKLEGKLLEVSEEGILVEQTTGKNKKAVTTTKELAFAGIKQAKVMIVF